MTPANLNDWQRRHGFTRAQAAARLGISRRMYQYYAAGERPIPRTVELATRAINAGLDGDRESPAAPAIPNSS